MNKALKELSKAVDKKYRVKPQEDKKYLGHRTNISFYIIIGLMIVLFIILAIGHVASVRHLRAETHDALTQLALVTAERDKYRDAYEIVLADVQAFSRMHHVQYEGEVEENETATPVPIHDDSVRVLLPDVWEHYNEQQVILDSCIETTKLVQTEQDEVEIVVVATSEHGGAKLRLFIDAQDMDTYSIGDTETISKTRALLPKGTHYLDLIYSNADEAGDLTISVVRIGDRTLENEISVIDRGDGLAVFDCDDTTKGDRLEEDGAMRFRIEKV